MKKAILTVIIALAMLMACEKESDNSAAEATQDNTESSNLKSAVNKNAVIVDQVKETVRLYFDGMENDDWDLMRSLVTDDFLVLEQGELYDVEGQINWLIGGGAEFVNFDFTLTYEDVLVKGTTAWAVFYDHLDVYAGGSDPVAQWDGLESAVLMKVGGAWKLAMLTATQVPGEE
ncbi:nuclear transport factor 2 family protein [Bacteroidota bacterium]